MPRAAQEKEEQEEAAGTRERNNGSQYPAVPGTLHGNHQRQEEELIALLRQEQEYRRRAAAVVAAAFPLPPYAASHLVQRGRETAQYAAPGPASFLAAAPQGLPPPPLAGISAATILDLARQRPDLLPMLHQPPLLLPHPAAPTLPSVTVVHPTGTFPAAYELLVGKRARSSTGRQEQDMSSADKQDKENEDEEQNEEQEEGEYGSRPHKRVMFQANERASLSDHSSQVDDTGSDKQQAVKTDEEAWTVKDHRSFVEAVYTTGIRQASPSVILDLMSNAHEFPLTSERVKSRLQKYRNHGDKSKSDFMQEYDSFLQRALSIGSQPSASRLLPPGTLLQIMGHEEPLYGGEAAALATYNTLYQDKCQARPGFLAGGEETDFDSTVHRFLTPAVLKRGSETLLEHSQGKTLEIPQLTEEEKATPLGSCLEHIMGTFQALIHQIESQREEMSKQILRGSNKATNGQEAHDTTTSSKPQASENTSPREVETKDSPVGGGATGATESAKAKVKTSTLKTPPGTPPQDPPQEKDGIENLVALLYKRKKGKEAF